MKRLALILVVVAFALILWNHFSPHTTAKQTSAASISPQTNSAVRRIPSPPRHRLATAPTDSAGSSEEKESEPGVTKLTREQIDAYLLKTKRSPESLLNAFQETGDTNFLAEAVGKFPDNPVVQWTMLNQEISPEEHSRWLERLKVSSPDNALPNYLSALDDFKAGKNEQALAEIDSASKKKLSSFEQERAQSREEMYLLSGYSPLEAKEKTSQTLGLGNLAEMKQLSQEIGYLQQKYKATGDNSSNRQLGEVGVEIGRKYSQPNTPYLINDLVGRAIENNALRNLDSETYYNFLGKTAGERMQEMKEQKQEIKNFAKTFPQTYSKLSDAEKMIYINRRMLDGEMNAWRWLDRNYGAGETK